jgi:hypothetical protein
MSTAPLGGGDPPLALGRVLAFRHLKWTSVVHSCVYLGLLVCAFAAGSPQPATFVLGLAHGILWIAMSLACITAARLRLLPLRVAVAVTVLGGIGPFFGSYEFVREQRRRRAAAQDAREDGRVPDLPRIGHR